MWPVSERQLQDLGFIPVPRLSARLPIFFSIVSRLRNSWLASAKNFPIAAACLRKTGVKRFLEALRTGAVRRVPDGPHNLHTLCLTTNRRAFGGGSTSRNSISSCQAPFTALRTDWGVIATFDKPSRR